MKKKILFLIPNLKHGGAEKVLINLVNNLDSDKYEISVQTLFDVGVHRGEFKEHIRYIPGYKYYFRGNTMVVKILPKRFLWNILVKEEYDVVISYLEGPTSRILGGCISKRTKKVAWLHIETKLIKQATVGFKSIAEAEQVYNSFDQLVAVSKNVKESVCSMLNIKTPVSVLYNTNETDIIIQQSKIRPSDDKFAINDELRVCAVAKLKKTKGFDRLLNVHSRLLKEGIHHHLYILGIGEEQEMLEKQISQLEISKTVTLLGYRNNPYQYVSQCDLYVCSSYREGFSTAVTEALVVGTPVVSTDCSGAKELLGEHNEYGIVVDNSEEGIYQGMKQILMNEKLRAHYKEKAKERGSFFSKEKTVKAVEDLLDNL